MSFEGTALASLVVCSVVDTVLVVESDQLISRETRASVASAGEGKFYFGRSRVRDSTYLIAMIDHLSNRCKNRLGGF